jgi:hypothetical protein
LYLRAGTADDLMPRPYCIRSSAVRTPVADLRFRLLRSRIINTSMESAPAGRLKCQAFSRSDTAAKQGL